MPFGQFVIGPPGSGKTSYCRTLCRVYNALGRKTIIVNLDPANDITVFVGNTDSDKELMEANTEISKGDDIWAVDVADLIILDDVMRAHELGPNGGIMYCIEYLLKNWDWLEDELRPHQDAYILFDCPGQVELYTHHAGMKEIAQLLVKADYRLCVTHLVDAQHCADAGKYIAVLLLSLKTMMQLELPQINVLSKVDLMELYGPLSFNLEYYTEVQDLSYLVGNMDNDTGGVSLFQQEKYRRLNQQMCQLVEEYSLVQFHPLCITDASSLQRVIDAVDKANGYMYGAVTVANN